MSKLGEFIAWRLNRIFPPLRIHQELEAAKRDSHANYLWAYEETRRIIRGFEPYWNLNGKTVLDIGTGMGGKIPFYIEAGAAHLTAIDLDTQNLDFARQHVGDQKLGDKASLVATDAARLPFPDGSFDAIVSINVFEHIENLPGSLFETYRVLKPGGLIFLHLPPYYSPWGPHLENWIHFPWPHLLFSDQTLLKVAAREDRRLQLADNFVPQHQMRWENYDRIPNVNRVTLFQFQKLVKKTGFQILQLRLLSVGYDCLNLRSGILPGLARQILRLASKLPGIQEIVVTKMVFVLTKN